MVETMLDQQELPALTREQVLELLGIKSYILKFWETEFDFISPSKISSTGEIFYEMRDLQLLQRIHFLIYEEKFSIERVRATIDEELRTSQNPPSLVLPTDQSQRQHLGVVVENYHASTLVEQDTRKLMTNYKHREEESVDFKFQGDGELFHHMAMETMKDKSEESAFLMTDTLELEQKLLNATYAENIQTENHLRRSENTAEQIKQEAALRESYKVMIEIKQKIMDLRNKIEQL